MRKTDRFILFSAGLFSNWAGTPFDGKAAWAELRPRLDALGIAGPPDGTEITGRFRGRRYSSNEQYMMSGKAWLMNDLESLIAIQSTSSPRDQKAIGRGIRPFDARLWRRACEAVVTSGAIAKFSASPRMEREILDTCGLMLVEASQYDTLWGIGIDWRSPDASDPEKWRGQNLLGKCLVAARDVIEARVAARDSA